MRKSSPFWVGFFHARTGIEGKHRTIVSEASNIIMCSITSFRRQPKHYKKLTVKVSFLYPSEDQSFNPSNIVVQKIKNQALNIENVNVVIDQGSVSDTPG